MFQNFSSLSLTKNAGKLLSVAQDLSLVFG